MKFIEVDNATNIRIVIPQIRGTNGRALTFEPKQLKVPVPQTCLSHPALIPYLKSTPPKLIPRTVAEVPVTAPVPKLSPLPPPESEVDPISIPESSPVVEGEPVLESSPTIEDEEVAAPENISEEMTEESSASKTGKKKKK